MIAHMKVLTTAQMREVDRLSTERYGIPSLTLMENAAARTLEAIERTFGPVAGKHALVVCGRGNNGGDGAALGRLLNTRGAIVDILLLGRIEDSQGDARINFELARSISAGASALGILEIASTDEFERYTRSRKHDFMIDAIFGTGLARPASGLFEAAITFLNQHRNACPVISVDIPSGLASDSCELIGPAVHAHLTVTFTAPKLANVLPPACDYNGKLVVASIGSPDELIDASGSRTTLVEDHMIESWLRSSRRSSFANKGDVGKVLVVAGSRGKTGAACLTGEGALRAGAGLVTVATADSSQPVIASLLIAECMTEPLAETPSGSIALEAAQRVLQLAAERDVVAIGPGIGLTDDSTRAFVRAVVTRRERPMVIDAGALDALIPWPVGLSGDERPMILTPHPGEMSRMTGKPIPEILRNRLETARDFAVSHGVILVLKGSRTVIAAPDGEAYINPTGNAGMATGGTGDVLTGVIAGLLAQKLDDPLGATIAAVYLHGLAGDVAASKLGVRAMIASDISAHLGDAFIEVGGDDERLIR
jgi:NAD(P)H-hydrate epimerase